MKKTSWIAILLLCLFLFSCSEDLIEPEYPPITGYAAALHGGIYKTENGGRSWFPLQADQEALRGYFKRLFLCPWDPNLLYITTTGAGTFVLDLSTETLTRLPGFQDQVAYAMAFAPQAGTFSSYNAIFLGLNSQGVFKTDENASSWLPWNQGLPYRTITALESGATRLYAGTVKGLFFMEDQTKGWQPCSQGLGNTHIYSLAVADPDGKILYLGAGPFEGKQGRFSSLPPSVYKSTDHAQTWTPCGKGLPEGTLIYDMAVHPRSPQEVFLGTSQGVYRSTDGGSTWLHEEDGLPASFNALTVQMIPGQTKDQELLYAAGPHGIFMTTNSKDSRWTGAGYGLPPTTITDVHMTNQPLEPSS